MQEQVIFVHLRWVWSRLTAAKKKRKDINLTKSVSLRTRH